MADKNISNKQIAELNNALEERAVRYTVESSGTKNKDISYMTGKNTKNDKKE